MKDLPDCTDEAEEDGQARLSMKELGSYLADWSCLRSFVPDDQEGSDHNLSVVPNPQLGEFQRFLVGSVCRHLEQTAIGEVACVVLGYLAPLDLLHG
jgi:hypothetical protein